MSWPKNFMWSVSTAAYQVEGGAYEDGKGLSNWDAFCKLPGKTTGGESGDVACDHYHRWEEDVALMKELGVNTYRFSINWARILPDGTGKVNEKGIAFYSNLIDACLANGIEPMVTLFHFDYPRALDLRGGWQNPESPYWFEAYADVVGKYFGTRVKRFITINEPQMYLPLGYSSGYFPPGLKLSDEELVPIAHNMLKGHGLVAKKLHSYGCQVGYAPCGQVAIPFSEKEEDIQAARTAYFKCQRTGFYYEISWWSDPVIFGKYPDVPELLALLPQGWEDDMEIISEPLDFYCQNIYGGDVYRYADNAQGFERVKIKNPRITANQTSVTPEALYWGPKFLYERYGKPFVVTENGMSGHDWVSLDGKVHDPQRVDYIQRYLAQLHRAIEEGIDVIGYSHWTLMDNFEWCSAYTNRYGLVYVDYTDLKRIPKDSFYEYKRIIAQAMEEKNDN